MDIKKLIDLIKGLYKQTKIEQSEFRQELKDIITILNKEVVTPPQFRVREGLESLGANYYCKCGVMFPYWEDEDDRTPYCGNCGQKLI
jgi:predicted SprT family Zn-dependent metalloprotease